MFGFKARALKVIAPVAHALGALIADVAIPLCTGKYTYIIVDRSLMSNICWCNFLAQCTIYRLSNYYNISQRQLDASLAVSCLNFNNTT